MEEKKGKSQISTEQKKKKKNAKKEKSKVIQEKELKITDSNVKVKQIDEKFQILFEEVGLDINNYRIYKVRSDGACGSNCTALACHHDERLGQYVRRNINEYIVKHLEYFQKSA